MTFVLKSIREFSSPIENAEQKTFVRPTIGHPYIYVPVICVPIGDVIAGDVVEVNSAYCQVTTEMRYNLMVSSMLIMTDHFMTANVRGRETWQHFPEITEAVGFNIDRNMHHYPVQQTGRYTVTQDMPNAHVVLMVWAASTAYDGSSVLNVDADRGRIEGAVHRAVTAADLNRILGNQSPEVIPVTITAQQASALQDVAAAIQQQTSGG